MMKIFLLQVDSRAVEQATGCFISLFAIWCWLGGWFGGFLSSAAPFHGYEWLVATTIGPYGLWHAYKAHRGTVRGRSIRCLVASGVFTSLGVLIWLNRGWELPGFPAAILASIIQGWCYLRIRGAL